MAQQEDDVYLNCEVITETNKAWLVKCKGTQAWFPKSQCDWGPEPDTLTAPAWLNTKWEESP